MYYKRLVEYFYCVMKSKMVDIQFKKYSGLMFIKIDCYYIKVKNFMMFIIFIVIDDY